jgi:hypothetical protein
VYLLRLRLADRVKVDRVSPDKVAEVIIREMAGEQPALRLVADPDPANNRVFVFTGERRLGYVWVCQSTVDIVDEDDEYLTLMARSLVSQPESIFESR